MLVSVLARYKKLFGLSDRAVCTDFFGVQELHSIVNFPSKLDYFERQLPIAFGITASILVRDCTLLPFFVPFMSTGDVDEIMSAMRGKASDSHLNRLYGGSAGCEFLRYCPECAKADREAPQRETYWRRLHQIGVVKVCPIHKVFLVSSDVRTSDRHFVSAEDAISSCDSIHRLEKHKARDVLL